MTSEKVREAIALYRRLFEERGVDKSEVSHAQYSPSGLLQLQHCHGMLDKMENFLKEGKREKAMRWLCFIQGVLWVHGFYTLNELRAHNRASA